MDGVLVWLSDNRDTLISAVLGGVALVVVLALGKRGKAMLAYLRRRLRGWIDQRRSEKEQKKEKAQREEERQRCQQRFLKESGPSPETDAGQVMAGALLDTDWRFVNERVDQEFVVLGFVIGRGRNGQIPPEVGSPVLLAARKFHSEAKVEWFAPIDNSQMYPYGHLRMGVRVHRIPN